MPNLGSILSNEKVPKSNDPAVEAIDLPEQAGPSNPPAGTRRLWVDSADGKLKARTSTGTDIDLEAGGEGGSGTVTSVGLGLPGEFSVSGSPVVLAGTLTASWVSQSANRVLASPNGSAGVPTFRALVAADLPAHTHAAGDVPNLENLNGTLDIASGGTGQTTVQAAINALTAVAGATNEHVLTKDTATGNAVFKAAAGGGGGTWTTIKKTADESKNNSAVVADDSALQFVPLANTQYTIRLSAFFLTNATADLKYRLVHTGTTTRVRRLVRRTATTDIAQTIELKTAFDAADVVLSTTGLNPWLEEDIILQVGATPGVVKLQWAQAVSNAGPTTCLEGSYLEYAVT